jgi:hypothetical protein
VYRLTVNIDKIKIKKENKQIHKTPPAYTLLTHTLSLFLQPTSLQL